MYRTLSLLIAAVGFFAGMGCGDADLDVGETSDPIDDCATCEKKSDGFSTPAEGSCAAIAMRSVANGSSFEVLDDDVRLDRRAAENIVETREAEGTFTSLAALDAVAFVGVSAFAKLLAFAEETGAVAACELAMTKEFVIVSDLDETVIPHASPEYSRPPYPGLPALYGILEFRNGGSPGDMNYVTARRPERVVEVPAYLEQHGVPLGEIETGVSGFPPIAEREKIIDVATVMERHPGQVMVLFGDDTAADPEAYRKSMDAHPERIAYGLIHEVRGTSSDSRFRGLHLYSNYVEAAAILFAHGLIDADELQAVRQAAAEAGLPTTAEQVEAWAVEHAP